MSNATLPVFNPSQFQNAYLFLATHVAEMMGRKFEEGDWAKVYCAAKGIPVGTWSNLHIDISYGNLGVEHKMICRPSNKPLLDACGTSIMHPAGTRAIRIPDEKDATKAARNVLQQYVEIIDNRTTLIRVVNDYHHGRLDTETAVKELLGLRMSPSTIKKVLPSKRQPIGSDDAVPDMRMGWLLWQESLREFLYFEERMSRPNPDEYIAEWRESGGGSRKASKNLWVYHKNTGIKVYSITTDAGAKIQPYFTVPMPNDPNLCHFVVQGEVCDNGLIRVWLTKVTAELLKDYLGDLSPEVITRAIEQASGLYNRQKDSTGVFETLAVEVLVPIDAYSRLQQVFQGVSDEHNFKLLLDVLRGSQS